MWRYIVPDLLDFVISLKEQWRKILTGSVPIALIGLGQGAGRFHVAGFIYWIITCATLFWAFFGAWKDGYRARKKAENGLLSEDEKRLLRTLRKLSAELAQLMWEFPDSDAVRSPLSMAWRPLVVTANVEWDKQQLMAWHSECRAFLDSLADLPGSEAAWRLTLVKILSNKAFPGFPPSALECLIHLDEIETLLLERVLN
jgi:hypothetical protein